MTRAKCELVAARRVNILGPARKSNGVDLGGLAMHGARRAGPPVGSSDIFHTILQEIPHMVLYMVLLDVLQPSVAHLELQGVAFQEGGVSRHGLGGDPRVGMPRSRQPRFQTPKLSISPIR